MAAKICFLSLSTLPYFSQDDKIRSGAGAGKQIALIGKELSKRDFEISFITYGKESDKIKKIDNVWVINAYNLDEAKDLNLFRKIIKILNCFKKTDSDIYVYSSGSPGITALYCFFNRKRYIYRMASDLHARLEDIENKTSLLKKISLYIDIKFAKYVVVQNNFQKDIIRKRFRKRVILLKNPIVIPKVKVDFQQKFSNKTILWVGHFSTIKQPELLLKLAKKLPQYKFIMIGGRNLNNPEIYENIKKESEKIRNLEVVGFVSPDKIYEYYKKATIFVSTSKIEGFPNVFLEAWVNYTPVISLNVDPDKIINEYQLGFHSEDFEQMIKDINRLMQDKNLIEKVGKNGRKYVETNHDIKKVAYQFENLIENLVKNL